jgi:hypothetical protein
MSIAFLARIICYMAGAEAEREILGCCHGGDDDDKKQIELMADIEFGNTCSKAWARRERRLRRLTARLVRTHKADILRVAEALTAHRTLSANAIDAMLQ